MMSVNVRKAVIEIYCEMSPDPSAPQSQVVMKSKCAVLVLFTGLFRVPRTCRVLVLAPVILVYALMTGARASAIRAGLMATIYLAAPFVGRLAAVSIAAWLSTTPLSICYFGRFAPIALVANLLVVPLAFLIVVSGCLALLAAAVGGLSFAVVFNLANVAYVGLLVKGMKLLEYVPLGYVENIEIGIVPVLIWYTVLIAVVLYLRRRIGSTQTWMGSRS